MMNNNAHHHQNIRFQNGPVMPNSGQFQGRPQPYVQENKRYQIVENHNSLFPQHLEGEKECSLCQTEYDLLKCVPMMVCRNQHNCCLQCAKQTLSRKAECPFCRVHVSVNEVKKNRILANIIENYAQKRGKRLQTNPSPEEQLFNYINGGYYERQINRVDLQVPANNLHQPNQPYQYPAPISGYARLPAQPQIAQNRRQQTSYIQRRPLYERYQRNPVQRDYYWRNSFWNSQRNRFNVDLGSESLQETVFLIMIKSVPFSILDLLFGFLLGQQKCMDDEENVFDFSFRSWLKVSGIAGLSISFVIFLCVFVLLRVSRNQCQWFSKFIAIIILVLDVLKMIGWNAFGFYLFYRIQQHKDTTECNKVLTFYMDLFEFTYIMSPCLICGLLLGR